MDIVEFAEKFAGGKLPEWQKRYIRTLDEMGKDARIYIVYPPKTGRTQAYIYLDQMKELLSNGAQNDRK